jgi:membrane dipeptidase
MPDSRPLVFDGHNDSLQALYSPQKPQRDLVQESAVGHLDLPRARRGGFGGGLFATFVPSQRPEEWMLPLDPGYARAVTEQGMRSLAELAARAEGWLRLVTDLAALRVAFRDGVVAAVMHVEGAEAVDPGLERLEIYHRAGLRSLGLVWSRPNAFGTGVSFSAGASPDQGPGLTDAGLALVRACNGLGIVVDLSHLNEKGFWDVARTSSAPLVASHSCVYALSPSPRNLTDRQLDAVAESGGVVGINFAVGFLRADNAPEPDTPLETLVSHFRYVADRVGVEHVAIGSDFDGCLIPRALGDVQGLPALLDALAGSGFSADEVVGIAHGNWFRVLEATWR